jgi:hypothetical protein
MYEHGDDARYTYFGGYKEPPEHKSWYHKFFDFILGGILN